jgi:hypothetical protein
MESDAASTAGVVTFTVFLGALPSDFLSKNWTVPLNSSTTILVEYLVSPFFS